MSIIRDPQADQIGQFFFSHTLLSLKCMATGRIKSKTGKGLPPRLCSQLPEAHQPSLRWFSVTSCGKREGKQAPRFLLYVVTEALKPQWQSQKNWARVSLPGTEMGISQIVNSFILFQLL